MREPVIHFVILGAMLLGLDAAVSRGEEAPAAGAERRPFTVPREPIVVDEGVRAMLVEHWNRTHPAPPTEDELRRIVEAWIVEEALYREGLARGLAESDPQIRERVASQMAYVLRSQIVVPEASEAELRAWFEAHPQRYARPERVDFTQVFVEGRDDAAEARARELLRLVQGGADPNGLGDTFSGGRRFRGRRLSELAERFGTAFTEGMDAQAPGTWAVRRSPFGLHLVRIDRWTSSEAPGFEVVRDEVRHDWEHDRREAAMTEATQALRRQWELVGAP
jgi:hypothetical protein